MPVTLEAPGSWLAGVGWSAPGVQASGLGWGTGVRTVCRDSLRTVGLAGLTGSTAEWRT